MFTNRRRNFMIQKLKHEHFDQIYDLLEANFIPEEYRSYEA